MSRIGNVAKKLGKATAHAGKKTGRALYTENGIRKVKDVISRANGQKRNLDSHLDEILEDFPFNEIAGEVANSIAYQQEGMDYLYKDYFSREEITDAVVYTARKNRKLISEAMEIDKYDWAVSLGSEIVRNERVGGIKIKTIEQVWELGYLKRGFYEELWKKDEADDLVTLLGAELATTLPILSRIPFIETAVDVLSLYRRTAQKIVKDEVVSLLDTALEKRYGYS